MFAHLAATEFVDFRYQAVEEFAVVAHDDSRAVEGLDGLFQHIFRWHVEVVGRLVEYQQIHGLQQQSDHSQSATLATAQHLHLLVALFAAKHKGTQYVVYLESYLALGHVVDGLVHGQILVEQLCLVLGKVAYLYVVAHLQLAAVGYLAHNTLYECRFSFAVLAHKGHLLAALNGQRYVVEHGVGAVILAHVVADDGVIAASQAGRKLQMHGRIVYIVYLDGHYLLQLFYLLLNLYSLGGLIAESFDKCLHISHFLLLVLVSP